MAIAGDGELCGDEGIEGDIQQSRRDSHVLHPCEQLKCRDAVKRSLYARYWANVHSSQRSATLSNRGLTSSLRFLVAIMLPAVANVSVSAVE